jgi:hypothetical protein
MAIAQPEIAVSLRRAHRVPGGDLPHAEGARKGSSRGGEVAAQAHLADDAMATLSGLDRRVNIALLHLHQALSHALHTLEDAERSIEDFEHRLAQHRARLRTLGYPAL